jgi:hypothetical protein
LAGKQVVLAAIVILAGSGWAAAQTGTAQTNTYVSPGAPVISADSPPGRNPQINPSAAGLAQSRLAVPSSATPRSAGNAEQHTADREERTAAQARKSLRYYGYSDIVNLHVNRDGLWQAQATKNGRRVKVVLEQRGTVTEPK